MSKSGFFWNDKDSRFSLIDKQRFKNTSPRPIMTEEVFRSWMKLSSLEEEKLIVFIKETNNFDEINNFFMNNYWNKIENFVKLMRKVSMKLKRFQGSTFGTISRRKLVEDRDTILELTGKVQELQNEVNCMNDSRVFKDAESVRSGQSHVTSQPVFFPPHPDPGGMPSRSLGKLSRKNGPPSIWDTDGQIQRRLLQHLIRKSRSHGYLMYQNTHHHMWWVKAKHQLRIRDASQDRQPEIQSSPVREDFQRIMEQTNNDCRFQILIWQIHHDSNIRLLEDKSLAAQEFVEHETFCAIFRCLFMNRVSRPGSQVPGASNYAATKDNEAEVRVPLLTRAEEDSLVPLGSGHMKSEVRRTILRFFMNGQTYCRGHNIVTGTQLAAFFGQATVIAACHNFRIFNSWVEAFEVKNEKGGNSSVTLRCLPLRRLASDGASVAYRTHSRDEVARWADEEIELELGPGFGVDGGPRPPWRDSRQLARALVLVGLGHQEELHRAQAEERRRQDHQLPHEQLLKQNWDLREAHEKSLNEIEELKKFQGSTFDTIARRRLVEDQDTILELTGKIQELQNEINCMNDSRDFQDVESVRSGHSHVTSQPVSFPTSSSSWWNAKPFSRNAES